MKRIAEFFQDQTGSFSATRLCFIAWCLGALVAWMYISYENKKLEVPSSNLIALFGVLMTGKVIQHFSETGVITAAKNTEVLTRLSKHKETHETA